MAHRTALEVARGIDLAGRHAVLTGGASGIGIETARAPASTGAEVTIAVRDAEAGAKVAAELGVRVAHLDLTDRASIARFVSTGTVRCTCWSPTRV